MEIIYKNNISIDEFTMLRNTMGWTKLHQGQIKNILKNSYYLIGAYEDEKVVGTARIVSDGGYIYFVADVIVLPEYQGKGIGKKMMEILLQHIQDGLQDEYTVCVALMAAKGMEGFYEKLGFCVRPNEKLGSGMTRWITKENSFDI